MAECYYEPTPATDGATMNPVPGATFQVFEIADTTFSTPLSLRVGAGNPTTTVTASESLATLPGVWVTSPNFEHIWVSGSFQWRRDSIDGAKAAIQDAKVAAVDAAASSDSSAQSSADSAQAAQAAAALVDAPADTVMAGVAANSGSAFATQLNATIADEVPKTATRPESALTVALGDSITGFNGSMETQNPGWFNKLVVESQGRIRMGGIFATGGWTSAQIEADWMPVVLAMNPLPSFAILANAANDCAAQSGTGFNFEATKVIHLRMIDTLKQNGIKPILWTVTPNDSTDLTRTNITQWNDWIRELCEVQGYALFDANTPCNNGTQRFKAGYASDGIHPTELGHAAIALYNIANGFLEYFPAYQRRPDYYTELALNGNFTVDTDANGTPDSWSTNPSNSPANLALSLIAPDGGDLLKGKWLKINMPTGSGGGMVQSTLKTDWAIGDIVEATARFRTSGLLGNTASLLMGVWFQNVAASPNGIYQWKRDVQDGLFRIRMAIPPQSNGTAPTNLWFRMGTSGTPNAPMTFHLGEVSVRNLSRPAI